MRVQCLGLWIVSQGNWGIVGIRMFGNDVTSVKSDRLTRRVLEGTSQGHEPGWRKGQERERTDSVGYAQLSLTKGLTMKLLTWRWPCYFQLWPFHWENRCIFKSFISQSTLHNTKTHLRGTFSNKDQVSGRRKCWCNTRSPQGCMGATGQSVLK